MLNTKPVYLILMSKIMLVYNIIFKKMLIHFDIQKKMDGKLEFDERHTLSTEKQFKVETLIDNIKSNIKNRKPN